MESTASKVSSLELDDVARMRGLLTRQQQAFLAEGAVSAATRIDRLQRCHRMIGEHQQAIIDACHQDFGNHSRHQAQMSEVMTVMDGLERASRQVTRWMKPERRKVMFPLGLMGSRAWVEFQPKGVVGNLSTWNFPVYTAILPLAGYRALGPRPAEREVPSKVYFDLATWHLINTVYAPARLAELREIADARRPKPPAAFASAPRPPASHS